MASAWEIMTGQAGKTRPWAKPGLDQLGAVAPHEKRAPRKRTMSRREAAEVKRRLRERLDEEDRHDELLRGIYS